MKLIYEKTREVKDPKFSSGNAGIDFFIPEIIEYTIFNEPNGYSGVANSTSSDIHLQRGDSIKISSGIKLDLPDGFAVDLVNKSGVALNGLTIGAELIDSSYTGEINFHLIAHRRFIIEPGMKIVQGIIIRDFIDDFVIKPGAVRKITSRGDGGFGSTGTK